MTSIPGYRFDVAKNRYFKIDPFLDKPTLPNPPSPLICQPLGKKLKTSLFSKQQLRDEFWHLKTQLQKSIAAPIEPLVCVSNLVSLNSTVFGTVNDELVYAATPFSRWNRIDLGLPNSRESPLNLLDTGVGALLTCSSNNREDNSLLFHYSPLYGRVSYISTATNEVVSSFSTLLGRSPKRVTCLCVGNSGMELMLFGDKGRIGFQDAQGHDFSTRIKNVRSDVLSASAISESAYVVGLRNGQVQVWDQRTSACTTVIDVSCGPVLKLDVSSRCSHLISCFSPNGDVCIPSARLLDMRFGKIVATLDLHGRLNSPLPMKTHLDCGGGGEVIVALDCRLNQYRVFDLETARFVANIPVQVPQDCFDNCLLDSFATTGSLLFSSHSSGTIRINSQENNM